jgi:hypothetical protein
MSPQAIVLVAFAILYIALNLRRLRRGRRWAFTFCQVAKEWEEGERAKRLAARSPAVRPTITRAARDIDPRRAS